MFATINGKIINACKQCSFYKQEDGEKFCSDTGMSIFDETEIDPDCLNIDPSDDEVDEEFEEDDNDDNYDYDIEDEEFDEEI